MKKPALLLASLCLVSCGQVSNTDAAVKGDKGTDTVLVPVAVCPNAFIGGTSIVSAKLVNGKLERLLGEGLEVIEPSLPLEETDGHLFGPRSEGSFNSGSIKSGAAAGRNVYFELKNNGGMYVGDAKMGIVGIEFDTTSEVISGLNLKLTILEKHNGKLEKDVVIVEDCEFPNFDLLVKLADSM